MNRTSVADAVARISEQMTKNRDYLVELDQRCGDGDLGITMSSGFAALKAHLDNATEDDLGRLFMQMAQTFNEAAPSSLGTILSFGMMGMAASLKGCSNATSAEFSAAIRSGVKRIMDRAGSLPGEKTILDSINPAAEALYSEVEKGSSIAEALCVAAVAAATGAESTKGMTPKHGRAAYYGDKNKGFLDGGAEVGRILFEAIKLP